LRATSDQLVLRNKQGSLFSGISKRWEKGGGKNATTPSPMPAHEGQPHWPDMHGPKGIDELLL